MPLYGNELDRETNPYEAGLGPGRQARQGRRLRRPRGAREGRPRRARAAPRRARSSRAAGSPATATRSGPASGGPASSPAGRSRRRSACRSRWPTSRRPTPSRVPLSTSRSATRASRPGRRPAVLQEGCLTRWCRPTCATRRTTSGSASRATRRRSGSPPTPPTSSATSSSSSCPTPGAALEQFAAFGVVESVKAVSDLFAPVSGEVIEANGDARRPSPELVNSDPYGEGWMIRVRLADAGRGRRPARRGRLRRADRGRLTASMPYGPHTADDRGADARGARPDLASTSSSRTSRPTLRASPLDLPEPEPELELAARLQRPGRAQPDRPRVVPRRRASTATGARPRSTSSCSAASGTRPTRRTSPRSARARSRASTSTSRCWPSWSTSTSSRPRTTTAPRRPPRPR